MKNTSYKTLITQKQYLKMLVADFINRFGDSIDTIAFNWMMYKITNSASMMAIILACNFIPNIIIQPFAAVFVEAKKKRNVMVVCDLGCFIIVGFTMLLFINNSLNAALLIFITLANSTLESIRLPASTAIIPKILDKNKYSIGIALDNSLSSAIQIIGMAIAGSVLAFYGISGALIIDSTTFLISAIIISLIKYKEELIKKPFSYRSYFHQLTEGFQYLSQSKLVLLIALFGAFLNFVLTPNNAFDSAYISGNLKLGYEGLSIAGIAMMCGMSIGTFFTPKLQKHFNGRTLVLGSGIFTALSFAMMQFIPFYNLSIKKIIGLIVSQFLIGATVNMQSVIFNVAFITQVKEEYISRVSGIHRAIMTATIPVSSLICSGLALVIPVPSIFLLFSIFMIIIYFLSSFVKEFKYL